MGFSELLEEMGGFGRYQWILTTLINFPCLLLVSQNMMNNFISGVPNHHCSPPANSSYTNLSSFQVDETQMLRAFIPLDSSGTRLDSCRRYVEPQWHLIAAKSPAANVSQPQTEGCLDGWTFDRTEFLSTTITEWGLVCSLHPLQQLIQSIFMSGVLAGAIFVGSLSDRFGRRFILLWSYLLLAVIGCASAFSPNYTVYCVFRFLSGVTMSGFTMNAVSITVEWVPTKVRTIVGTVGFFTVAFGQMALAGISYSLRDWRKLQVALSAPHFLFFAITWWCSESARWLVLTGRTDEALKILHRVARINGKPEVIDKLTKEVLEYHMKKEIETSQLSFRVFDLLRARGLRRISICLLVIWFANHFAYYGLAMDLQNFKINAYLMQLIFGAVEIPTKLVVLFMLSYLGRRVSQLSCLSLTALVIIAKIFIPSDMQAARTMLACLGKAFAGANICISYLYTGELYPTIIRQTGLGFATTMARFGAMVSPMILILDKVLPALPSLMYAGTALLAVCFTFFLPETLNMPLPDTIDDVELIWSRRKPPAVHQDRISSDEGKAPGCGYVFSIGYGTQISDA